MPRFRRAPYLLFVACLAVLGPTSELRADEVIDSPMYRDPVLPSARVIKTFPEGLTKLWLEALGRPEADYQSNAALAIASARQSGMAGLEATVAPLARELDRPDLHPSARLAVVRALVTLDAREVAPALLRLASSGDAGLGELIDPALARWDYKPARAEWLERLDRPPRGRATVRTIQALTAVREGKAASRLRELVFSGDAPPSVRLEAAIALGVLRPSGSEEDAGRLAADSRPRAIPDRLAAASLLRQHRGDAAIRLLLALAKDDEPAVAAVALARLIEIDPGLVDPILTLVLASPDATVRGFGVEVLFRRPADGNIRLLGDRLTDPHPGVRVQARRALRELAARPQWRGLVVREGTRVLAAADWRGLEQAAILLAQIGHKPAAARLVELLPADRPEVCVAAAWGLRQLAVPDTLPAALEYFRLTSAPGAEADRRKLPAAAADQQLCQLAQFFGQSKYLPADAALRRLIPPRQPAAGMETRAAAIWGLGRFHKGTPDAELVGLLVGRIRAVRPVDIEDSRVRRMSAIALGLMEAKEELPTLREFFSSGKASLDVVSNACGWAIEQLTGEPVPPETFELPQRNWFLSPLR